MAGIRLRIQVLFMEIIVIILFDIDKTKNALQTGGGMAGWPDGEKDRATHRLKDGTYSYF